MSVHDPADIGQTPILVPQLRNFIRIVLTRPYEIYTEFLCLLRGLDTLCRPFRARLMALFGLNVLVVVLETVLVVVGGMYINALGSPQSMTYLEIVAIITVAILGFQMLHESILPAIREIVTLKCLQFDLPKHITRGCIDWCLTNGLSSVPADRQPIIKNGCQATLDLTTTLVREPAFIIRGFIMMGFFFISNPLLMAIGTLGMLIDLAIVLYLDNHAYPLVRMKENTDNAVWGTVSRVLDDELASKRSPEETEQLITDCMNRWDSLKSSGVVLGVKIVKYDDLIRNPISLSIKWCLMLILAWWVYQGHLKVGDFTVYIALLGRASSPFEIIYKTQRLVMNSRQKFRKLGQVYGIDFGIVAPRHASAQ